MFLKPAQMYKSQYKLYYETKKNESIFTGITKKV